MAQLFYQGHSSFRIISGSGLVLYIDPYKGEGYDIPADVILVTHDHFDHCRVDIVEKKPDTTIITYNEAITDGEYNAWEINDILVEAVPAYNKNHPKESCVGYVITLDGRKLYFAGDTGVIEEMKDLAPRGIDIFFCPMDGIYTMTTEEAELADSYVKPGYVVPIHTAPQYQKDDDSPYDIETAEKFRSDHKVIVRPGESMVV